MNGQCKIEYVQQQKFEVHYFEKYTKSKCKW